MANFQEIARKKVAGVPVIYLAAGAVVILAIVAYKMRPSSAPEDPTTGDPTEGGLAPTPNPYDSLSSDGTVTVVQGGPSTVPDEEVSTNSTWVTKGAAWLVKNKSVPGSDAIAALNKYINGQDKSYDEKQWVDAVIAEYGAPPDGIAEGGKTGYKPASTQGTPPTTHTVKGASDNTYGDIAALYYGHNDQPTFDLVQAANPNLGLTGPFPVGTKINVPAYHVPSYYTVPSNVKSMTSAQVASKNGISVYQIEALNNTSKTTWTKGSRVRVK
jgi:hypothetical protein